MTFENRPAHAPDSGPGLPAAPESFAVGHFHGKGGELFLIWLSNAVLTALTLGIYFAWGKVRLYKFFYSNTEFAGSRFRFTGNGKEIFIGTLKAVGIILGMVALLALAQVGAHQAGMPFLGTAAILLFYLTLVFLSQYALYSTMGYRASRARFREIAFRLEGSPWAFARAAVPYLLLGLITLGLAMPYYTHWRIGRIYNNLKFGSLDFAWDAEAGAYCRLALKGIFLSLLTLGVYYFFWMPRWFAFVQSHLSVGGSRFHGEIKPGELFKLAFTNLLLMVFTLGLGSAWVITRSMRFFLARMALRNPALLETSLQASRQKIGVTGEAMGDAMDMGVGLGF
jgi:uncharacterized membrane protein YjgN (DUF898 family)